MPLRAGGTNSLDLASFSGGIGELKKDHPDLIFSFYMDGPLSRTDCVAGLKLVMLAIRVHYSPNREVYPGIPRLAKLVGLSEKQVERHIKTAIRLGFVNVVKGRHKTNTYELSDEWKAGRGCPIQSDIEGTVEGTPMSPKEYPIEEYPAKQFPKSNDLDHPPGNANAHPVGLLTYPLACMQIQSELKKLGLKFNLVPFERSFADEIIQATWVILHTVTSDELARYLATRRWPKEISEWKYFKTTAANYAEERKREIWNGKPEFQLTARMGNEVDRHPDCLQDYPE